MVNVYPRNQTAFEGKSTEITCIAKGVPSPAISWTFDKGELPSHAKIRNSPGQSALQLSKTSKRMEGWYTCKAKNKAGEAFSSSILHVLGLF